MAKVVDITEKLGMQGRPELKIGDARVKVDNTAKTMLQVLTVMGDDADDVTPKKILEIYDLLFDEKSRKELDKIDLDFDDFTIVVESAMDLVMGDGGDEGNARTPATA